MENENQALKSLSEENYCKTMQQFYNEVRSDATNKKFGFKMYRNSDYLYYFISKSLINNGVLYSKIDGRSINGLSSSINKINKSSCLINIHYLFNCNVGKSKTNNDIYAQSFSHVKTFSYNGNDKQFLINELNEAYKHVTIEYDGKIESYTNESIYIDDVRIFIILQPIKINKKNVKGGNWIKLPSPFNYGGSLVNIKNKDEKCFMWSVLACMNLSVNSDKPSKYKEFANNYDFSMLNYPVSLNDIDNFSKGNKIFITVFELLHNEESNKFTLDIIFKSNGNIDEYKADIKLLLYKNHYVCVRKLNLLLKKVNNIKYNIYPCEYCDECFFYREEALDRHILVCSAFNNVKLFKVPTRNENQVFFKNHFKSLKVGIKIYADFEVVLQKYEKEENDQIDKEKTFYLSKHVPCAVGCCTIIEWSNFINEFYYSGLDCVDKYIDYLFEMCRMIKERYILITSLSHKDIKVLINSNIKCVYCNKNIDKSYVNGRLIENYETILPMHSACCLRYYKSFLIVPVLFHNLKGYDSHLFIDKLASRSVYVNAIPISKEKYISFSCVINVEGINVELRFLDSLAFLSGSLASNANNLTSYKYIGSNNSNLPMDSIKNLNSKLPFPYEYISSFEKLFEQELPCDEDSWYSSLTGEKQSMNIIQEAIRTFKERGCMNILDYMMLYLRMDVLLLAEIFESFRSNAFEEYGLDPLHYYTTPGLAWDSALKKSGVVLDLLMTKEQINFFTQPGTIRGGISTAGELKYSGDVNDDCIMYYDVTNLYGYAMTKKLPVGNFEFEYFNELTSCSMEILIKTSNIISNYNEDDEIGYIFEVDLDYPLNLAERHNALPFMVERYNEKLIPIIRDKYNYRCHICILKQAIEEGLILRRVHKIIKFKQSAFLNEYIMSNTLKRASTVDANKRNFYKLMNNAVYGKTIENILNRSKFNLMTSKTFSERMKKRQYVCKVISSYSISPNLVVVEEKKLPPVFNKPVYLGFSILEISKRHMYFLLYKVIKPKFEGCKLMYMDTDSLIIKMNFNISKLDYRGVEKYFDLSGYKNDLHNSTNKGILGTLKDEYPTNPIKKFICIKSKCYAMIHENGVFSQKNKGISNSACESLTFESYKEVLEAEYKNEHKRIETDMVMFKVEDHKINTVLVRKVALSSIDEKRVVVQGDDGFFACPIILKSH
jgi:hypothetical protein